MFDLYRADGVLDGVPDMSPLRDLLDPERALIEKMIMLSRDSMDRPAISWVVQREGAGAIQILLRNPSLEQLQLQHIHEIIQRRWKFHGPSFGHREMSPFLNLLLSHPSTTEKFRADVIASVEGELQDSTSINLLRLLHSPSRKEWLRSLKQLNKGWSKINYEDILLTGKHYPEDLWAMIDPQPRFSSEQLEEIVDSLPVKTNWGKDVASVLLQNSNLPSGTRLRLAQANPSTEALISLASNPGITESERNLVSHHWGGDHDFRTRRVARKLVRIPNMWLLEDLYLFLRPTDWNTGSSAARSADDNTLLWGDHPEEKHYVKNIMENPGCSDQLWKDALMRSTPEDLFPMSSSIVDWHADGRIDAHLHNELVDIFTYHRGFPPPEMQSVFSTEELLRAAKRLSFTDLRKVLQATRNIGLLSNVSVQPGDQATRSALLANPATPQEVRDRLRGKALAS